MMADPLQVKRPPLIGTLIQAFTNDSAGVRRDAVHVLARMGPQNQVVSALSAALKDDNEAIRYGASQVFRRMDFRSVALLNEISDLLKDENEGVRLSGTQIMANWGPDAAAAVPALIATLKDKSAAVRRGALKTLGEIGAAATATAMPFLIEALMDGSEMVRVAAIDSLANIGEQTGIIPALLHALRCDNTGSSRIDQNPRASGR